MKKISLLLLAFCLCGGIFYLLTSNLDSGVDPVSLLPVDTLAFIDVKKPAKSYVHFKKSSIGKQVESISVNDLLQDLGFPEDQIALFSNHYDTLQAVLNGPLFKELFGRRALLALLPREKSASESSGRPKLTGRLMLICRPQHRTSLLQFFSRYFTGQFRYTSFSYLGKTIRKYSFNPNLSVFSAVTDGLVILTLSEKPLKDTLARSLEKMTSGQAGLDMNREYLSLKQRAAGRDDQFVYADLKNIMSEFELESLTGIYFSGAMSALPYKSGAFFRQHDRSSLKYTGILRFNNIDRSQERDGMKFPVPVQNHEIGVLPDDLIVYLWSNLFNLQQTWVSINNNVNFKQAQYLNSLENWFVSRTRLSVEQFLGFFGSRASLNITKIRTTGFFPMPRVCLQLELTDTSSVKRVMSSLFAELPVRHSMIKEHDVFSILLADGLIQPSYSFVGTYLVVADSYNHLRHILRGTDKTLARNLLIRKSNVDLTGPNNFILFIKDDELIEGIKELTIWFGMLLKTYGRGGKTAGQILFEKVAGPVLEGMKMYRANVVRGYTGESEIVFESALLRKKNEEQVNNK